MPVWVPSLGERLGLLFPSVSRSCRLTRTVLAWYNTHTQVWCVISAAWLGDQFGSRLGDQFGCQVWVPSLGERFGLLFPSVSRSWRLTRKVAAWYNTHTQVWSPISAAWLGDRFGIARVVCFGAVCQSKSNEVRNGMRQHSHTGLVYQFGRQVGCQFACQFGCQLW